MKVYEFASTREFLKTSYESAKEGNSALTIGRHAKRLGIGGSTLKMILSGKRRPTIHHILNAARALRLAPSEISFLETLILSESAKGTWEKSYFAKVLARKKKEVKLSFISSSQRELLTDAIAIPLLVYILESGSTDLDFIAIADKFGVSTERINALVAVFSKSGLHEVQTNGKYHVAFDKMNHRVLQKNYIKNLLVEAAKRVEADFDDPTSLFVSYAFSATDESLLQLQLDLKTLMEKYMAEDNSQVQSRRIAQACFQVFPVTKS